MTLDNIFHATLGVFTATQILDVVSTNAFLKRGKGEANPAVRWMLEKFGPTWFIPKLGIAGAAGFLLFQVGPTPLSIGIAAALSIAEGYAIWINGRAAGWWK